VQIRIPIDGRFLAQPPIEWIRVCQHLRVEELIQTKNRRGSV